MQATLSTIGWIRFPDDGVGDPVAVHDLTVLLDAVASAGFAAVGVDTFTLARTATGAREAAQAVRTAGLRCSDVGVLRVGRDGDLDQAHEMGELARELESPVCITVLEDDPTPDVVDRLRACAEVTAAHGVWMALEFVPYGPVATLPAAVQVCERVGWDRCGLLLDTWHFFHTGEPWAELERLSGDQVALVQVNDAPAPTTGDPVHESRFRRVPMGDGRFDLDAFGSALRRIGYDGPVSVEVLSAELAAAPPHRTAAVLRESLARLIW